MERIVLSAAGKINLFLRVLSEEVDGFHHVETLYQSVDVRDKVEIIRGGDELEFETKGLEAPTGPDNLAFKAAQRYLDAAGMDEALKIRVEKSIPVGAGLGGGSADAAAVLTGLNVLFEEMLTAPEMIMVAGSLGSDVPFALKGGTAIGWSRGDRLVSLSPLPSWPVLICIPDFKVDTGDAYRMLDVRGGVEKPGSIRYDPADFYSLGTFKGLVGNDFESIIQENHHALVEIKDTFRQLGGQVVQMTGTGSAVFALFSSERERAGCLKTFEEDFDYQVLSTRLTTEGIQVEELE
jgi:4-diphosphocytidyl-2-C-methyl-D-erythritol kinase